MMRPVDILAEATGTTWRYFRKNFRGGYIDKWTSSPLSVCKIGGSLAFGPPPGVYRVEVWRDDKYVTIGDAPDLTGVSTLLKGAA